MTVGDVIARVDALAVDALSTAGVSLALADVARVRAWCDAQDVRLAQRLRSLSEVPERVVADVTRSGQRHGEQTLRRVAVIDTVPEAAAALTDGTITGNHLDVLGRVLHRLPEHKRSVVTEQATSLLAAAATLTPEQFQRHLRDVVDQVDDGLDLLARQRANTAVRTWTDRDGMVRLSGAFDPERECAGHGIAASDLPVETIRRMACTANIIPAVLDGNSVPLDVGRRKRLATRPQRRALRIVYDSCAIPRCTVPLQHCEPHHLDPWQQTTSKTALPNLLPLCSHHHHRAHEGQWQLQLGPDRTLTITRPDGSTETTRLPGRRIRDG